MSYLPQDGDVVTAEFYVVRKKRGYTDDRATRKLKQVFGCVQRVTPKRVLVETLRIGAFGFSRTDVWVPRESVKLGTLAHHEKWQKASGDCNAFARAVIGAYASESHPTPEAKP